MLERVKQFTEHAKINLRNERNKAVNTLKKIKSKDLQQQSVREVQIMVDKTQVKIEELAKAKEASFGK
jgi:ribosome recycling factor